MTSSTSTGERRWAPARRGGMTVLGKVAVPKPLNLPSQKLENHGLDPTVEIVPKGTLSWGSRSSSSASNAWGSSSLSPGADGGTSSPSHLSGRPSSGSGTRPSTAGSDRTHEPTANAWGPNSRPSSASGALPSNQTSLTSLRPRSAETRPGSSQLSRFAEQTPDVAAAWAPNNAAERLGMVSSKRDGFSLSSGDFPTLGSEKDNSGKITEVHDHGSHGRPNSASGGETQVKDKGVASQADGKSGTVDTWKRDTFHNPEDGIHANMEKWQGDPRQYHNANVPPQHFDAWRGPPLNPPAGVWYRGPPGGPPPGGPPYGAPLAPGGFPMEPFPYYRPQIPPPALANSQPVPPQVSGPRGRHPTNGELYRPQMPEAYMRPGMPFRPGFYPGPVPFDGYYGPPMGYCNANEREIPFINMAAGPPVYNRHPSQNASDPNSLHARASSRGSSGKTLSDQVEPVHSDDAQGSHRALTKRHSDWDGKEEGESWETTKSAKTLYSEKVCQPGMPSRKYHWGDENDGDDDFYSSEAAPVKQSFVQAPDDRGGYLQGSARVKSLEGASNVKAADESWAKRSDIPAQSSTGISHVSPSMETLPDTQKDSSLMRKIEGLNAKARASEGRPDVPYTSSREEKTTTLHGSAKGQNITDEAVLSLDKTHASKNAVAASHEVIVSVGDKIPRSSAVISRRPYHGAQGRTDHRAKGKFSSQDDDAQKKHTGPEPNNMVASANAGSNFNVREGIANTPLVVSESPVSEPQAVDKGSSYMELYDSADSQAQRAKMRELAKQRAIQLQREEEERTREQKAKALAKLEELNRRTQASDASAQKVEKAPPSVASLEGTDESQISHEIPCKLQEPGQVVDLSSDVIAEVRGSSSNQVSSTNQCGAILAEIPKPAQLETVVQRGLSSPKTQDVQNVGDCDSKTYSQPSDLSALKNKRSGYKQKQSTPLQRNLNEKSVPIGFPSQKEMNEKLVQAAVTEVGKVSPVVGFEDVATNDVLSSKSHPTSDSNMLANSSVNSESSAQQRRRNNRNSKNRNKLDEVPPNPASSSITLKESNSEDPSDHGKSTPTDLGKSTPADHAKSKAPQSDASIGSIQAVLGRDEGTHSSEPQISLPSGEAQGRNQWKSQQLRRAPRNQHGSRFGDKLHSNDAVIWAPVRSQNKDAAELSQRTAAELVPPAKSDSQVQNNSKSKRAEMERYVPKPVAKELAQQGGIQQPLYSSNSPSASDELNGKGEPKVESSGTQQSVSLAAGNDNKEAESKPNKHGKSHGAWRPRNPAELAHLRGSSSSSDPSKNVHKSTEQIQSVELDATKPETTGSSESTAKVCLNISNNSDVPTASSVVKDHGITGKGKRHSSKGRHRSTGSNQDLADRIISSAEIDGSHSQSAGAETNQRENVSSKESRGPGERTSAHWQPKFHGYSTNNQRGTRSGGSVTGAVEGTGAVKDSSSRQRVNVQSIVDEKSSGIDQPRSDQLASEGKSISEVPSLGNQASKREKKVSSLSGRPHSPNQSLVGADKSVPATSVDTHHEQHSASVFRRIANHNNRSSRTHESHEDGSSAQDNRQPMAPARQEKHGQNMHYEYQPVGPYNSKSNSEGLVSGAQHGGPKYRERGHSYSKRGRGNFQGRQSGTVRVDN